MFLKTILQLKNNVTNCNQFVTILGTTRTKGSSNLAGKEI